jgi:hypothetical protein
MKPIKIITLIIAAILTLAACNNVNRRATASDVVAPESKGSKRILFVGNSHTQFYVSLPNLFAELCKENQQDFKVETFIEMGVALDEIYNARKEEITKQMAVKDADGNYYDYVVLQEKTPVALDEIEKYKANVKLFVDKIHENSPGTVVLIYELMTPFHFVQEKEGYTQFFPVMKANAMALVKETSNSRLLNIGSAVKNAYEGKYAYISTAADSTDLLREEGGSYHMLNDGGFMSSVLIYETIFNAVPKIPAALPLSAGIDENEDKIITVQAVDKIITNKMALMKIAFDNK